MRKYFVLLGIILLFPAFSVHSQEKGSSSFAYRSFSIAPLGIYIGPNAGVTISGDVSFDYGKNIFSLGLGTGTEAKFVGNSNDFTELNLFYGRSFKLSEKSFVDVFAGTGYFYYHSYNTIPETGRKGYINQNTIGFPIGAKLQFKLGARYSMGIKAQANLNSIESIGSLGLALQWNKKRK